MEVLEEENPHTPAQESLAPPSFPVAALILAPGVGEWAASGWTKGTTVSTAAQPCRVQVQPLAECLVSRPHCPPPGPF